MAVTRGISIGPARRLIRRPSDKEAPEVKVAVGDTARFTFSAVRSGQFIIELHAPDGTEAQVGLLTVHEP